MTADNLFLINASPEQMNFINLIKDAAIQSYNQYMVLPSLTIAQAILESNWGTSALAKEANNLFGLKWTDGYDYVIMKTREYSNNEWIVTEAKFRKYGNISDSITDHALLLQRPQYTKVLQAKDYREAAYEVWRAGYATDPDYPQKLIDIIEKYELYKIDEELLKSDNKIKDYEQVANWAKDAVKNVFDEGIMVGSEQGYFYPAMPCTRQEMAVIVYRLLELVK